MQRAYELMIIIDRDVDEAGGSEVVSKINELVTAENGKVASTDDWGRRKFAYPINKKFEGHYLVFEIVTEAGNLDTTDRFLRLADAIVRHKIMRLPEAEAARRGLLASAT